MDSDSSDDDAIPIPKWKLILTLKEVLKANETGSAFENKRPVKRKTEQIRTSSNQFQKQHPEGWNKDASHLMSYMTRVCELSKQLTSTHRWAATARMFSSVARQVSRCPIMVWKTGAQCLTNHQETSNELLYAFANTMVQVGRSAAPCIALDHLTHLLSNGDYQVARRFLETHQTRLQKNLPAREKAILNGYRGIMEYFNWMEKKNVEDNDEIPGNQLMAITSETEVVLIAERAINFLKEAFCFPGNFDIFMIPVIELLEYYERLDELLEVLRAYLRSNPLHPTPYVCYYTYLVNHWPANIEQQIEVLKDLAEICPSHPLVLTLCKHLPDNEFLLKVEYLINLIDYEEWCRNVDVWQALVHAMTSDALRCKEHFKVEAYERVLKDRSLWWPAYHFKVKDIKITDHDSAQLVACKAVIVAVMYSKDQDHEYISVVKRKLALDEWISEMDYLDKTLEVAYLLKPHCNVSREEFVQDSDTTSGSIEILKPEPIISQPRKRKKLVKKSVKVLSRRKRKDASLLQSQTMVSKSALNRKSCHGVNKVHNTIIKQPDTESSISSESDKMPKSERYAQKKGRPQTSKIVRITYRTSSSSSSTATSSSESESSRNHGPTKRSGAKDTLSDKPHRHVLQNPRGRRPENKQVLVAAVSNSSECSSSDESMMQPKTVSSALQSQSFRRSRPAKVVEPRGRSRPTKVTQPRGRGRPTKVTQPRGKGRPTKVTQPREGGCPRKVTQPNSTDTSNIEGNLYHHGTVKFSAIQKTSKMTAISASRLLTKSKASLRKSGSRQKHSRKESKLHPIEASTVCLPAVRSLSDKDSSMVTSHYNCRNVSVVLQRINVKELAL